MPLLVQRASAGSGKTEQLARRYLQILLAADAHGHRVDPASILAVTFTRKAAGEMLARIFKVVATACTHEEMRSRIVERTGLPSPTQDHCYRLLRLLVEQVDRLSIETIDALFAKQAQAQALDLGMAPCWSLADSDLRDLLAKKTVLRLVEKDADFAREWSAIHHFTRRVSFLEEAAALLEKNHFFARNLMKKGQESLIARGSEESGPRLLTQKEAESLRTFLESFSPPLTAQGKPNTHWKKALQQLKEASAEPLLLKDLWNLSSLTMQCLKEEPSFYGKPIPEEFLTQLVPLIKASAQEQRRLALLREETLERLMERYQQLRYEEAFQAGAYTFEEIEAIVTGAFSQFLTNDLARSLESRVEHLLLDEYQDTSQRQHNFLSFLMKEVLAKGGTTFVVGDVKQGIYGWRGGKRYLLQSLEEEYAPYLLSVPSLHESYRSSNAVLAAVNEVFSALNNEEALLKMETEPAFKKAAARWCLDFEPQQRASSLPELGGRVLLHEVEEPLSSVLQKVIELVVLHRDEDPEREVAILVRRTKFIPPLLSALRSRGILASGEGGNPLADTLAVEVLLSLLSWIDHPGNSATYEHVTCSPLAIVLNDSPLALRKQIMTQGLPKMLRAWIVIPSFYEACSSYERERLQQLVSMAHRFEITKTLSDFVEQVRHQRIESPLNQGVRVLSIHASKGLEFESVILMDLDTNIFAGAHERLRLHRDNHGVFFIQTSQEMMALQGRKKQLEELHQEQWAEALSLLYVGMTRAISYLDLVILPSSNSSKKSIAQWLRASGLKAHHATGKSWREQKQAHQQATLPREIVPTLECKTAPLKKLSLRSPTQENNSKDTSLAQQFYDSAVRKEGILKHALLAEIEWLEEKLPTAESWASLLVDRFPFQKTLYSAKDLLERFQREHELKAVFQRATFWGQYPEKEMSLQVWRERSFAVVLSEKRELLTGTFDRVVLHSTPAGVIGTIIDFKTAPQRNEEREKKRLFYQPQLDAYGEALRKLVPGLMALEAKVVWI
ncbi:MAG: UvrD-helicase domain-containing protein [Chthoniobacterales bacterium]|nr:UvrD-helicase domain-containing protein [Chthoniobacterales bacterium]